MRLHLGLFILSLLGIAATWGLLDLFLVAALSGVASLILLLLAWARSEPARKWVVFDGSNAICWWGGAPDIGAVQEVLKRLTKLGYTPGVMFDANAGYLLAGRLSA